MQIFRLTFKQFHCPRLIAGALIGLAIFAGSAEAQVVEIFEVTNILNAGPGSLRQAIEDANASTATTKTITFTVASNATINLTSDLPDIDKGVTIDGSTAVNLTVDGSGATRIFRIGAETTTVRDLGLEGAPLEIASGASLSFDVSGDQQFDDVITDAGGIIKKGDAALTLRGENNYTGGTLVSAGTLIGDTTSLQGSITNNALVVFDQIDENGEYMDAITGTGAVQKTGAFEVEFTGANTYSGGTTVSEGVLRGDTASLQGNIAVETGGEVIFDDAVDATFAGNLTGAGSFTKPLTSGASTLTLTGTNTISGESNLDAGGLQGSFSSIPLKLETALGTLVTFDQDGNGTYAGAISGDGAVTKTGTGTLTLSGTHTYAGLTTVDAGTLSANPLTMPNETDSSIFLNNAALIFNSGGSGEYQGVISGSGDLTKSGSGTLSLTGVHTFTGLTKITAGRLDVDGSLFGGVDVGASAVLGGTGSIGGTVTVDGTVAPGNSIGELTPGNSIGELTVDTNIIFESGSVFEVEVEDLGMGTGNSDHLDVLGVADLTDGSVLVSPGAGSYLDEVTVTILTAVSTVGEFSSFGPDFALLDITIDPDGTSVILTIVRNEAGLGEFAETPNQATIAAAFEAALVAGTDPDIETVSASMNLLTVEQVPNVLDSMTGETLTQFATTRLATAERFGRSLDARIRDHQWETNDAFITAGTGAGESSRSVADSTRSERIPVLGVAMLGVGPMGAPGVEPSAGSDSWIRTWVDGSGIYGDVDGNSNASDFDYTIWGGSLGADVLLDEHWVLGLAGGYANTDLDFSSRPGDGEVDTYQGAVYAGYVDPRFHVGVSGRYAHNDMDGKRDIRFGEINRKASADLDGKDYGVRFDGALNLLDIGGFVLQPTASVNYNHLTQDDVTESGAMSLNLAVEDFDIDSLVTGAGMRVRGRWNMESDFWMVAELHGRWLHEFLDTDRFIEARLVSAPVGASSFQIQGVELPRDSGSVGLSWSVITDSAWSIIGSYDIVLNKDLIQHIGSITLNFAW